MNCHHILYPTIFRNMFLVVLIAGLTTACDASTKSTNTTPETSTTLLLSTATNTATFSPSPTFTFTVPPTATATQTNTPEPTLTSTPVCLLVLNPQDGIQYPELGEVKFEWEKVQGAAKYRLEMTTPMETTIVFETFLTSVNRYLIMYPWGGSYTWKLSAIGPGGNTLCGAGPFSFTKLAYAPTPKSTPDDRWRRRPPPSEACG